MIEKLKHITNDIPNLTWLTHLKVFLKSKNLQIPSQKHELESGIRVRKQIVLHLIFAADTLVKNKQYYLY